MTKSTKRQPRLGQTESDTLAGLESERCFRVARTTAREDGATLGALGLGWLAAFAHVAWRAAA